MKYMKSFTFCIYILKNKYRRPGNLFHYCGQTLDTRATMICSSEEISQK